MKGARCLKAFLQIVVLISLTWSTGCGGEQDIGTPEQLEKVRQHKIKQAERFQREG